MKRQLSFLGVAVLGACGAGHSPQTAFDGESAYGYVQRQVAFGPRVPNTDAHERTGDWILNHLHGTADSVEVQAFEHVTQGGDTLRLRNFIGRFRPDETARVLFVAHWDTRPMSDQAPNLGDQLTPVPGANDGASGVAVLLGVADVLAQTDPAFGVDLLFVDGEDYSDFSGPDVLIGSRYYAAGADTSRLPLFAVVWDMIGDADLEIFQEANSVNLAPEVVNRVWSTAQRLGYSDVFVQRVGTPIIDDHMPLLEVGIRAIDVIDFHYGPSNRYWHTPQDTPDKVSAASLQVIGDVAVTLVM